MRLIVVLMSTVILVAGCASDGDGPAGSNVPETENEDTDAFTSLPEPRTEVAGTRWVDRIAVVGGLTADSDASPTVSVATRS